jgi:hypothetical protein
MVALIVDEEKAVYVSGSKPSAHGDQLSFRVDDSRGAKIVVIPREGTVIIDYDSVYGDHFENGNRTATVKSVGGQRGL